MTISRGLSATISSLWKPCIVQCAEGKLRRYHLIPRLPNPFEKTLDHVSGMMVPCAIHHEDRGREGVKTSLAWKVHTQTFFKLVYWLILLSYIVPKETSFAEYSNPDCPS